jgi:hypothetical protein
MSAKDHTISLTSKGLANLPRNKDRDTFAFLVGSARYSCAPCVADFLSPKLSALHKTDPTMDQYVIATPDPAHAFPDFLSLGYGETIRVLDASAEFLLALSRELENDELFQSILSQDEFTVANVVYRLRCNSGPTFPIDTAVEFGAAHFADLESSSLESLPPQDLALILCHPSLRLCREDELCLFLLHLLETNLDYFHLLEFVHFEYCTVDVLQAFSTVVLENLDCLTPSIWSNLSRRWLRPVAVVRGTSRFAGFRVLPQGSSPLEGIIAHLTRENNGNVHKQGVVTVTGNEDLNDSQVHAAWNAADLTEDSVFFSKNEPNQSLTYDFGDRRVRLTHYAIRSRYNGGSDDAYLQSWVVECSLHRNTWTRVDRRENNSQLRGRDVVGLFDLEAPTELCRFVRLRQTGPNHSTYARDRLVVAGFELFGELNG